MLSLFYHDERVILVSELLQIYHRKSEIIDSHIDIVFNPFTLKNTNREFDIIKLPNFFNDSKVRDGS